MEASSQAFSNFFTQRSKVEKDGFSGFHGKLLLYTAFLSVSIFRNYTVEVPVRFVPFGFASRIPITCRRFALITVANLASKFERGHANK